MFSKNSLKVFVLVVLVLVMSGVTYAFAAANIVPASHAGDGQAAISGYTVSAIHYTLNAGSPSLIDSVSFTLSAPATTAHIQLNSTWYGCTVSGGTSVTCDTTGAGGAPVSTATNLQVVAAD